MAAYGPGYPTEEGRAMRRQYYPAVRGDCYAMRRLYREASTLGAKVILTPLLIVDFPISACFDTIAWPFKFVERRTETETQVTNQATQAIGVDAAPQPVN
jgi:uncharacterized protein YceK